eukprot:gene15340-biopygen8158
MRGGGPPTWSRFSGVPGIMGGAPSKFQEMYISLHRHHPCQLRQCLWGVGTTGCMGKGFFISNLCGNMIPKHFPSEQFARVIGAARQRELLT